MANPSIVSKRRWQRLGNTLVDLAPVVKIEFEHSDARLFVVSGEALLMTAWTESRSEISALKQLASEQNGWISANSDSGGADEGEYGDADPLRDGEGDAEARSSPSLGLPGSGGSDHRVRLLLVDRIVYTPTPGGSSASLFAAGVYLGRVDGQDEVEEMEATLGV